MKKKKKILFGLATITLILSSRSVESKIPKDNENSLYLKVIISVAL